MFDSHENRVGSPLFYFEVMLCMHDFFVNKLYHLNMTYLKLINLNYEKNYTNIIKKLSLEYVDKIIMLYLYGYGTYICVIFGLLITDFGGVILKICPEMLRCFSKLKSI